MTCHREAAGVKPYGSQMFRHPIGKASFGLPHIQKITGLAGDHIDDIFRRAGKIIYDREITLGATDVADSRDTGTSRAARAEARTGFHGAVRRTDSDVVRC